MTLLARLDFWIGYSIASILFIIMLFISFNDKSNT